MSKKSGVVYEEIPGNAAGSHAAYVRALVRVAEALLDFEQTAERLFEEDVHIRGMSIRMPDDDRPEYMAVVRVYEGGVKKVGFHNAPSFSEVVVGVVNRLKNRSMKFKDDEYE